MWTCNRLDLQTLGSRPVILSKNLPDHCHGVRQGFWLIALLFCGLGPLHTRDWEPVTISLLGLLIGGQGGSAGPSSFTIKYLAMKSALRCAIRLPLLLDCLFTRKQYFQSNEREKKRWPLLVKWYITKLMNLSIYFYSNHYQPRIIVFWYCSRNIQKKCGFFDVLEWGNLIAHTCIATVMWEGWMFTTLTKGEAGLGEGESEHLWWLL